MYSMAEKPDRRQLWVKQVTNIQQDKVPVALCSQNERRWKIYQHLAKLQWWCAGVVICLQWSVNDLHMVQLMPQPPIISCFIRNTEWFCLSGTTLPRLSRKRLLNGSSVVVSKTSPPQSHFGKARHYPIRECTLPLRVLAVACTMRNEALWKRYGMLQERYETLQKRCGSVIEWCGALRNIMEHCGTLRKCCGSLHNVTGALWISYGM